MNKRYDVALSFAGEQRDYIEVIANFLLSSGMSVYYDIHSKNAHWGQSLTEITEYIYAKKSDCVVLFISKDYCSKKWPRLEAEHSMKAMSENQIKILPIRFDDSILPGLDQDIQYLKVEDYLTPQLLAKEVAEKLGFRPLRGKDSNIPPPRMKDSKEVVRFNYSNNNGRYIIGSGKAKFETMWTKASNTSIHLYNEPLSIQGVALVQKEIQAISDVMEAKNLNFTSRCRTVEINQVAILRNIEGFYAAIQVLEIKDDTRGDQNDEVRFRYVIQLDGSDNFSNI
ncbi:MAG: toll/interleukin-1 receptor domain-containing protein [Flavobacteriaceae bacterium]|nr:toll/interleukin-1 receptor domain-containing protein [Flavobacteriaceae bacterium]